MKKLLGSSFPMVSRRKFVQGLTLGGVLAATPAWLQAASASEGLIERGVPPVLSGTEINLVISEMR